MTFDMFGSDVYKPSTPLNTVQLINRAHGFAEFWLAWPKNPRKVAKQECLNKWAKNDCARNATHIIAHVESLKLSEDWINGRIPMPATYLNQKRWDGYEPEPPRISEHDRTQAYLRAVNKNAAKPSDAIRAKLKELTQ